MGLRSFTREKFGGNFDLVIEFSGSYVKTVSDVSGVGGKDVRLQIDVDVVRRSLDRESLYLSPSAFWVDGNMGVALSAGFVLSH